MSDTIDLISDSEFNLSTISIFQRVTRAEMIGFEKRLSAANERIKFLEDKIETAKADKALIDLHIESLEKQIKTLEMKMDKKSAFTPLRPSLEVTGPPKITRLFPVPPSPIGPPTSPEAGIAPKRLNFGVPRMTEAQAVAHELRISIPPSHMTFPLGSPTRLSKSRSIENSFLEGLGERSKKFDDIDEFLN